MFSPLRGWRMLCLGLAAWAVEGLLAAPAAAAWIGFRNDTNLMLVVQPAVIVNNVVLRGRQIRLLPGQHAWENMPAGPKRLTILDASQPVRILFDDNVLIGNVDAFFSLQLDIQALPPRIKILPARPPTPPPAPIMIPPQPPPFPQPKPKGKHK